MKLFRRRRRKNATKHNKNMTINEAIKYGTEKLSNRFEAELILCHIGNISRSYLYAHQDQLITPAVFAQYEIAITQRQQGVPVAYIIGSKEFWSMEFEVNEHTLIPRPETELLVQLTLNKLSNKKNAVVADLGTGSGAIALALAKERPDWDIYASDISTQTLAIAARNRARHHLKNVTLLISDWLADFPDIKFDAIVSNPPYIAEDDEHLADLKFEPQTALTSGQEGLDAIKIIINDSFEKLNNEGWLLLEHGFDQARKIKQLMLAAGYQNVASHRDFSDIERVTLGKKREK